MTMIKYVGGIVEINGKSGSNIWRHDQCIQHMQTFPRQVQHDSPKMRKRRSAFSKILKHYLRNWGTQSFAQQWQIYADNHPRVSKKYGIYRLTWWTQFISTNLNRVIAGLEPYRYPSEIP